MNAKLKAALLIALCLAFAALGAGIFIASERALVFLTLLNAFVIAALMLESMPVALFLSIAASLLSVFSLRLVGDRFFWAIPANLLISFGAIVLFTLKGSLAGQVSRRIKLEREEIAEKARDFEKELAFYEEKEKALARRGEQRRRLAQAARELGSLLEPAAIQERLLQTAQTLFPNEPVKLSLGENSDALDNYVIQKRQPLLLQEGAHRDNPFMAAPVSFQRSVAGVLRVGGAKRPPYTKEDFRLLEILASLASMALDNSHLFNQVKDLALRDGLTGLLTHRAFNEQLDAQVLEASRYNHPLSVILADLDHFKAVNDTYGHQAGDQILQGFAHVLVRNVREVDVVSRYGGEEFILLLLQFPHEEARRVAEQIRQDLASLKFDISSNDGRAHQISVTGSFGVSSFPTDATSAQQLIRLADQRLYQAKNEGRNRVVGR